MHQAFSKRTTGVNMVTTAAMCLVLIFTISCAAALDDDDVNDSDYWEDWSENLNRNINLRVRSGLRGLDSLNNLGAQISQQVQESLKPLDNLGASISQQVHQGLRPVREMQFKFRMKSGDGGTTIATFKDKQFIFRNGVMYECEGTISEKDGGCSGTLRKPTFSKKEDFCYAGVRSQINEWYCLGVGSISTGYINGRVYCNGNNGSPTLLINEQEYKNLCGNRVNTATYKYFTNGPLGEHGSDVHCSGSGPYVCTFTETSVVSPARSFIHIN